MAQLKDKNDFDIANWVAYSIILEISQVSSFD